MCSWPLAEGDEDALILQQFEEALIESLQGDPDIAACLNTYVEARRKLQDKARSRGFWNSGKSFSGYKGKGRGGKNKGGFSQNFGKRRLPLAQRILNSHTVPFAIKKDIGRLNVPIVIVPRVAKRPLRPQPSQE